MQLNKLTQPPQPRFSRLAWRQLAAMFLMVLGALAAHAQTTPVSGSIYTLTNACSNKLLDVSGVSTADGAAVHLWSATGALNQQWKVVATNNGYSELIAQHSQKALDVPYSNTAAGTKVWQYSRNGTNAQQWQIVDAGNGYVKLVSRLDSSKVLDVAGAGTSDGTAVQIWNDLGNCAQQWKLTAVNTNLVNKAYEADNTTNFPNPERGIIILHQPAGSNTSINNAPEIRESGVLNWFRNERARTGATTVRVVYNLGSWKAADIPQDFLDRIQRDFDALRSNGFKMIPYFTYAWVADQQSEAARDASADWIVRHTEQLKPVLNNNKDVIALMFAAFIGAWGEWHHSSSGNIEKDGKINENTRRIFAAILAAVPSGRSVALRYPSLKQSLLGESPLSADEAFSGAQRARVGLHDEVFLQNLVENGSRSSQYDAYIRAEGPYTPSVEAFDANFMKAGTQATCAQAYSELARRNSDFMNDLENRQRIESGCEVRVRKHVGYRYRLLSASLPPTVAPGGSVSARLTLTNDGYGSLFNPRGLELVLRHKNTGQVYRFPINSDGKGNRSYFPHPSTSREIAINGTLSSGAPLGEYEALLNLPDPAPSITARPEYSIRLANQGIWEASTGYNSLLHSITVQANVP